MSRDAQQRTGSLLDLDSCCCRHGGCPTTNAHTLLYFKPSVVSIIVQINRTKFPCAYIKFSSTEGTAGVSRLGLAQIPAW